MKFQLKKNIKKAQCWDLIPNRDQWRWTLGRLHNDSWRRTRSLDPKSYQEWITSRGYDISFWVIEKKFLLPPVGHYWRVSFWMSSPKTLVGSSLFLFIDNDTRSINRNYAAAFGHLRSVMLVLFARRLLRLTMSSGHVVWAWTRRTHENFPTKPTKTNFLKLFRNNDDESDFVVVPISRHNGTGTPNKILCCLKFLRKISFSIHLNCIFFGETGQISHHENFVGWSWFFTGKGNFDVVLW